MRPQRVPQLLVLVVVTLATRPAPAHAALLAPHDLVAVTRSTLGDRADLA